MFEHTYKAFLSRMFAVIMLFAFIAIGSCNKEDANANCTNGIMDGNETGIDCGGDCSTCSFANYRIKRETFTSTISGRLIYAYDFFYLPDGRIDSIAGINEFRKYTYSNNQVIEFLGANTNTYTLNSSGYATSVTVRDSAGAVVNTYNYTYDAEGHRINNNSTAVYQDGNLITVTGATNLVFTYTNKFSTINLENKGQGFLGKESVNLAATIKMGSSSPDSLIYQFDVLNRVTRVEANSSVNAFTYY